MKKLLETAKRSRTMQRLSRLLDRAIDGVRDALAAPELQPIPVRVKRRKG